MTSYGTQSNRRSLAYALKQMLAREIELEKMRQYESNLGPIIVKAVAETPTESKVQAAEPPVPNHKLALKPKAVTPSYKVKLTKKSNLIKDKIETAVASLVGDFFLSIFLPNSNDKLFLWWMIPVSNQGLEMHTKNISLKREKIMVWRWN